MKFKFNKWIITGLLSIAVFSSGALSATNSAEDHDVVESLQNLKLMTNGGSSSVWPELEKFQASLWKAMALDPGPIVVVPVNLVPKSLFAEELTTDLSQQIEALKLSALPKTLHVQEEFNQYLQTVRMIMAFRISRKFPQSRASAKRGTLDESYDALIKKIRGSIAAAGPNLREDSIHKIENYIQTIKDNKNASEAKKAPFANGNQFIWAALVAFIGFAFGITAIKMNPEFFEKFISPKVTDSTAPAATHTHQLNYARWLREFEELLAKLKVTQLTHERRIEEVVQHSEKLNQFATALCADPRIKNESNLEFRMSNLLRELHRQLEQAHELKMGDRAQIHTTLEHCLKLCDAIENNGLQYHHPHGAQQPQNSSNTRSAS